MLVENAKLNLPNLYLAQRGDPVGISPRFLASENKRVLGIVWHCLQDPAFTALVQCWLVTDGHTMTAYTALA